MSSEAKRAEINTTKVKEMRLLLNGKEPLTMSPSIAGSTTLELKAATRRPTSGLRTAGLPCSAALPEEL